MEIKQIGNAGHTNGDRPRSYEAVLFYSEKEYYKKSRIIFGYTVAPSLCILLFWVVSPNSHSKIIVWLIFFILESLLGFITYRIIRENKETTTFHLVGAFMSLLFALSIPYSCYLLISSLKSMNESIIATIFLIVLIFEWYFTYNSTQRGFLRNLDLNKSRGIIDLESGTWNLQKQVITSRRDADEKFIDRWYSVGKVIMYFAPAIGTAIARKLPHDQNSVFEAALISLLAIFMISGSARSAALAKNIAEIEKEINKVIKIKTLE